MKAGAAAVDVTPPPGLFMDGFSARKKPAQGVNDPLYVRALVVGAGKSVAAIVTLDLCSFPLEFASRVKKEIQNTSGISRGNILLNASHTHFCPILREFPYDDGSRGKPDAEWIDLLAGQIVGVVKIARDGMKECRMGFGKGFAPTIGANRRVRLSDGRVRNRWRVKKGEKITGPAGPVDPEVGTLYFEDLKGAPIAVLFSYACHPTIGGYDSEDDAPASLYSASYPGYARELVERMRPGVVALFAQGAGGNVNPRTRESRYTFKETARLGRVLGYEVLKTLEEMTLRRVRGPVRVARKSVSIPIGKDTSGFGGVFDDEFKDKKRGGTPGRLKTEIQAIRIGPAVLVALPGEVFVEYALRIKEEASPDSARIVVLGYSNHIFGYVPTAAAFREGGYETEGNPLTPDVEKIIVERAKHLAKHLVENL